MKSKVFLISIACVFVLGFFFTAYSQKEVYDNEGFFGLTPQKSSFSLLDPSRLKMSHSYTLSYYSSKEGSGNAGLYLNTLQYRVSEPLTLTMNLGYLHSPVFWQRSHSSLNNQRILSDFQLEYKKSSFYFLLKIGNLPKGHNPYYLSDWRW